MSLLGRLKGLVSRGPSPQYQGGAVECQLNLFDSEILKIERVVEKLNESVGKPRDLEGFRKEAIERFGLAGFDVDVATYTTNIPDLYTFVITINDVPSRRGELFDHEKMTWEVQHDILGIDFAGAIQPDGVIKSLPKHVGFSGGSEFGRN